MSVRFLLDYWSLTIQISDETARRSALCRIFYLNNFFQTIFLILLLFAPCKTRLVPTQPSTARERSALRPTLRSERAEMCSSRHRRCVYVAAENHRFLSVSVYRTQSQRFYSNRLCLMYTVRDWFWLHSIHIIRDSFFSVLPFCSFVQHMKTALQPPERASFRSKIFIADAFPFFFANRLNIFHSPLKKEFLCRRRRRLVHNSEHIGRSHVTTILSRLLSPRRLSAVWKRAWFSRKFQCHYIIYWCGRYAMLHCIGKCLCAITLYFLLPTRTLLFFRFTVCRHDTCKERLRKTHFPDFIANLLPWNPHLDYLLINF